MADLKARPTVVKFLFISAEETMDLGAYRTREAQTAIECVLLARTGSHLATPFDPAPPPVALPIPLPMWDLLKVLE